MKKEKIVQKEIKKFDKILPYPKGRLVNISRYLRESKSIYSLVILFFDGKLIPACDIYLTETEFINNLQHHFKDYDFVPELDFLRRLETLGFLPRGGLLTSANILEPIPKYIDTDQDLVKNNDVKLLYKRYENIIRCYYNKQIMFEGPIELAGIAPSLISSSFVKANESKYPIRLYLFSQIKELERFLFLTAYRFIKGIAYYEKKLSEFEVLVYANSTLESRLQEFLTQNFWIWGFEYTEVIPKQQLGEKYEIDFLLKRIDGVWEIVEIERSCYSLFTKKLEPRKELRHAIQQVIDYQSFCIRNYNYLSSENSKDIFAPKGYVIMGNSVSDTEKRKLEELNKSHPFVEIYTYQYLINRAKRFIKTLKTL